MRFAALPLLFLLTACATPQQQCISEATRDLRATQALIAESRRIIERGYTLETRQRPDFRFGYCRTNGTLHVCYRNVWVTDQRRIPADIEAELAKLKVLERKEAALTKRAEAQVAQCQRHYPE